MSQKTEVKVVIAGKVLQLSGYESPEYYQSIATYINEMIEEYESLDAYRSMSQDVREALLKVNIAGDYFAAKREIENMDAQLREREKEVYKFKQDLIAEQMKLETAQKQVSDLRKRAEESTKTIAQLEAQVKSLQGKGNKSEK